MWIIGGMQDFSYLRGNCFEITFKVSCCKYPNASDLYNEWNNNKEALLAYMEKVRELSLLLFDLNVLFVFKCI